MGELQRIQVSGDNPEIQAWWSSLSEKERQEALKTLGKSTGERYAKVGQRPEPWKLRGARPSKRK